MQGGFWLVVHATIPKPFKPNSGSPNISTKHRKASESFDPKPVVVKRMTEPSRGLDLQRFGSSSWPPRFQDPPQEKGT